MLRNSPNRYGSVAMTFHWVIALLILTNIAMGYFMNNEMVMFEPVRKASADVAAAALGGGDVTNSTDERFVLFQIHKSIGLTVLVLSVARLIWRLVNKTPPLSVHLKRWEKISAHIVHSTFYVLMIGLPLLGWAAVSVAPIGLPTLWFTLFRVPHLPILGSLPRADKIPLYEPIGDTHIFLAYSILILLVLHVGGALKHQFLDKDGELGRMMPFLRPKTPGEDS